MAKEDQPVVETEVAREQEEIIIIGAAVAVA